MLVVFGKLLASFYIALAVLWLVLIAVGYFVMGRTSSACSTGARPDAARLLYRQRRIGLSQADGTARKIRRARPHHRLRAPLGYSFNLDGSMLYCAFAALFISQAYGIDLSLTTQITMLLV